MTLRPAKREDAAAIRAVLVAAFPTPEEADLVDRLRADSDILLEWAAEIDGEIVGAVQYSPLRLARPSGETPAAALAPLAVRPGHQRQGLGARLIEATLPLLRARGDLESVVVLGHPAYYPRFGFSADAASATLIDPFDAGAAFMALPLAQDAPAGRARPIYAPAFGLS